MKYTAKKLKDGRFAVFTGRKYFFHSITSDLNQAKIAALKLSARWYRDQADKAHKELEKLGQIDNHDPYGYLA